MALPARLCLLAFCLALAPPAVAASEPQQPAGSLPAIANPAGDRPFEAGQRPKRRQLSLGERAVRIAAAELGVPYRYGGASPSGFDCSGLVTYVYGKLGVELPHNAAAQYAYGRPVDGHHLEPGDLVFFHGLGHVGLYIGRGRIIHAPQTGERVEIQSLGSRSGTIEGARRIAA